MLPVHPASGTAFLQGVRKALIYEYTLENLSSLKKQVDKGRGTKGRHVCLHVLRKKNLVLVWLAKFHVNNRLLQTMHSGGWFVLSLVSF